MFSDLKQHKGLLFFVIFCGALSSAFKASATILIKSLGNLIFKSGPKLQESPLDFDLSSQAHAIGLDPLHFTVLLLGLSFIITNIFRYIFMYNIRALAETKAVQTREKLMAHYLSLDAKFKSTLTDGSGGLISRILNDVMVYQQGIGKIADLIKEPFLILFSVITLVLISWKVAAFLLLGLPPILIVVKNLSKSLRKHSTTSQETMESVTMTLKEGLDGSRIIHSFNLEKTILDRFQEHTGRYLKTIKKIITREEASGPLTESFSSIIFCGSFVLIAYLVESEGLTFGDFLGISAAVGFLTDAGKKTQAAFIRIQQASVAKSRINSIIEGPKLLGLERSERSKQFPKKLDKITFKSLSVEIDENRILDSINFSTTARRTIALVGPSGSGKSTLLNCLDGYMEPTSGEIIFNDLPISQINSSSLRENISLVSQDPFLFNTSVYENLSLAREDLSISEAEEALKLANADFVLSLPDGIMTEVGEAGGRFSGGERQRISIARALVKNAPILLLDEATSALDTQSEIEVQKGLDSLKSGRTCFVVAHRLSTILNADLILVMDNGKIVESGSHEELLKNRGLYQALYGQPV
jgi:ATP-binding cassette subfamily B protein/subfamily B ATP-binding cassette protein MsbA